MTVHRVDDDDVDDDDVDEFAGAGAGAGAVPPDWIVRVVRDHHRDDGSWVYSVDTPRPDGAAVVLVHGIGNDGGVWAPIMPTLAEHGPVVAPTVAAGLLRSDARRRLSGIEPVIDHLCAVADPPWHLVGHSMGGVLAGLVLRHRRDLVESLVLVNSPLPGITHRLRSGDSLDRTGRALLTLKALALVTALGRPRLPPVLRRPEVALVRAALTGFVADPASIDDRVISRAIMATRTSDAGRFLRLARDIPDAEAAPVVGVPVTIVIGDDDPLVPVDDLTGIRSRYPEATVHVLDRCGHFAHLEHPARTAAIISGAVGR